MRTRTATAMVIGAALTVTLSGAAAWPDRDEAPGCGRGGWSSTSAPAPGGPMASMMVRDEAGYLAAMVPHHEEAIRAATELARSDRPEMRELGESVVRTQTAEVDQMRTWLDRWYPDQPDADYEPMMRDLSRLTGDALDEAFLRDMIGHHMMAVMMSQQLVRRDLAEHPEVEPFATEIRDQQRVEMQQMRTWLQSWFDVSVRHPGRMHR